MTQKDIAMLGTITDQERDAVFTLMRWVKVPSTSDVHRIEGLYTKLNTQDMMFGLLSASPTQKQVQYVTKPIGAKVTLVFGPEAVVRECKQTFELMVRLGLVAAVLLKPEEAPRLPSVLHQ